MSKEKIFCTTWGYNMTIVEFFQVVRETASTFWVKEIAQVETGTGYLSGTTMPVPNKFISRDGEEPKTFMVRRKKDSNGNDRFSITDYPGGYRRGAYQWDGKPKHFNHCD